MYSPRTLTEYVWFILPYGLDTIQVYFPASPGIRSISFKYQIEVFRYGSNLLPLKIFPSLSQEYLRGAAPIALHVNMTEWLAGHALKALFKVSGSENVGGSPRWEGIFIVTWKVSKSEYLI